MNVIVKSAVAGALALGASSAFALAVPSSGASDLFLYVDAVGSGGSSADHVYALDTGVTLSSLMPGPYVTGAANSTVFAGVSKTISASTTLQTFLSTYSSSSIQWTLEGGQFNGSGSGLIANSNTSAAGSALGIFTSPTLTSIVPKSSTATLAKLQSYLQNLNSDITSGGLSSFTGTETATATTVPSSTQKYNFFGTSDLSATGSTSVDLFGFTGNNGTGTLQQYLIGSATLSSTGTLVISPNAAVPIPAAVWLFGSGVLGLVGVSRRRKLAVTA